MASHVPYEQNNNEKRIQRLISHDSAHLTDYDSEEWSDDGYYDNVDDVEDEGCSSLHALLEEDMDRLKTIYGADALSYRLFSLVDSIDIELFVQTSFLEREMAIAWKIKPEEPLVIRLHLSVSHYLDGEVPKVEVFQPSQKEKFGIGSQMRKILENFFFEEWKNLSNDIVRRQLKEKICISPLKKNWKSSKETIPTSPKSPDTFVDPQSLAKIIEMGFSVEMGKNALVIARGDVDEAVTLLLTNPECCEEHQPEKSEHPKIKPGLHRLRSREMKCLPPKPGGTTDLMDTSPSPGIFGNIAGVLSRLTGKPLKTEKDAKDRPGLDQGFLVMVMRYVYQRLPTMNEFCVVCDELHVFQNGGMLKPAVCARELCVFAFMSLGVMSDAAEDIATGADVVDLLIAIANAACRSQRREQIFDPFPTVIDPDRPKEFALSPKKKDFNRAKDAINSFMRMAEMMTLKGPELKKELDKRDSLSYPLLQWIVTSNRSHVVKLPLEKQIACMRTPHQFLLMSSPPAKEAIFRAAKEKHGSTFAFHGSPLENWHSIMRLGLINASGTKYQRHGAAYGKGIYLSPNASVSFSYSGMNKTQPNLPRGKPLNQGPRPVYTSSHNQQVSGARRPRRFLQSTNLTCIALCEVITSKNLRKNNQIWVMPDPDHVCTRFFFVYEDGQIGDSGVDTANVDFCREVQNSLGYHAS